MITKTEAIKIATEFINTNTGKAHKLYGAKLIARKKSNVLNNIDNELSMLRKQHWAVSFETQNEDGHILDGPTIVIVDSETAEAHFFPNLL